MAETKWLEGSKGKKVTKKEVEKLRRKEEKKIRS
jgi:hypothetical protein